MRVRRTIVSAALGSMLALGAVAAPAHAASADASASVADEAPDWTPSNAPAGALACGITPTTNGYGGATVTTAIHLRTGPSKYCGPASGTLYVDQRLGGWCKYWNGSNWWYYVSVGGEAPYGWIYGGNVSGEETIKTVCDV